MIADLRRYLVRAIGPASTEHYCRIFEELRPELGYADYLGALQRYRIAYPPDPCLLAISSYLVNYPFANRLFPGSLDVLERFAEFGPTVILTDGDVVFQPRKIERSGLGARSRAGFWSISTRKESWTTWPPDIPRSTTCWWTTSSTSWPR